VRARCLSPPVTAESSVLNSHPYKGKNRGAFQNILVFLSPLDSFDMLLFLLEEVTHKTYSGLIKRVDDSFLLRVNAQASVPPLIEQPEISFFHLWHGQLQLCGGGCEMPLCWVVEFVSSFKHRFVVR